MEYVVNISVEIEGKTYKADADAVPQSKGYIIVTNAGWTRGGDVPYENLQVFQVESVIYNERNQITGVKLVEPISYFTTMDHGEYMTLVEA